VSDGCYTPDEIQKAQHWMKRCHDSGVAVLWLPFDHSYYPRDILKGTDGIILDGDLDPSRAATEIGKAAATALSKIGARNAAA
jgi:hypothetical protein